MKYLACTLLLLQLVGCGAMATVAETSSPLAFEGAKGFGRYTVGGKGGQVYVVSSLADNPTNPQPGSLRYAVKQRGARQITFSVSGVIKLQKTLEIKHDFITIDGQTSPYGIVISGADTSIEANQVILRYLRFRPGSALEEGDALSARNQNDIIIDHCSMSWANDEVGSFYNNTRFTLQHSILSESLRKSTHHKGSHGYGGIWGGRSASFMHNVMAHHDSRVPRINGYRLRPKYPVDEQLTDVRNNVFYNWGSNSSYGGENGIFNVVGNYYRPGPATKTTRFFQIYSAGIDKPAQAYIAKNLMYGHPKLSANNRLGVKIKDKSKSSSKAKMDLYAMNLVKRLNWPVNEPQQPIEANAELTWQKLIVERDVGVNRNAHGTFMDSVDSRILQEIASGTATFDSGIIDNELQVISSWDDYAKEFSAAQK